MNKYKVIAGFTAKTSTGNKQLRTGQIVRLTEKAAAALIERGKIKEISENRTTAPVPVCACCSVSLPESLLWTGRRYCLGLDRFGQTGWNWFCIRCRPYN